MGGLFVNPFGPLIMKTVSPLDPHSLLARRNPVQGPKQNGRHFPDDIFKCIFLNENAWISIKNSLKFVPNGLIHNSPALVEIMAWRRPGVLKFIRPHWNFPGTSAAPLPIYLPNFKAIRSPKLTTSRLSKILWLKFVRQCLKLGNIYRSDVQVTFQIYDHLRYLQALYSN